jgi:ArsR family transcriptional regulator, arsenate/arsenite/antimonite-responsive transcriptional repressor
MIKPDPRTENTARALAALGHPARLDVFRLLVRAGNDGMIVGDIALHTGLPLSTLAHHLRALVTAGLVEQERRGREIVNSVNYDAITRTVSFLTDECCHGVTINSASVA